MPVICIDQNNTKISGYLYDGRIDAPMLFPSDNLQSSMVGASKSSPFGENIIRVSTCKHLINSMLVGG